MKKFISGELSGWKKHEVLWLAFCIAGTCAVSIILDDGTVGTIASITGTAYTVVAGKGKISCYLFGIVNTILYGYVSMQNRLWGEVILNWGWYLPMMFVGLLCWKRKLDSSGTIYKTKLSSKGRIICTILCIGCVSAGTFLLKYLSGSQPLLDSITTILSIAAMILTVKRCAEQWIMWTAVNTASIWMWFKAWQSGSGSAAVLAMWIIALANGIIFYFKWKKEAVKCPEN